MSQRRALFRSEAIAFQRQRQSGEVILLQPVAAKLLFWSLAAVFALIVAFLVLAQYARKETVVGYLAPTAGVAKVFVPRAGTVTAVHVREGRGGRGRRAAADREDRSDDGDGQNVDALSARDAGAPEEPRSSSRSQMQEGRALSERERLEAQIVGRAMPDRAPRGADRRPARARRAGREPRRVASQGLRANGYISEVEYKRRRESHLESKQNLGALGQQLAARRAELAQATAALEQLPAAIAEKVQALHSQIADAEQRVTEIEGRRAYRRARARSPAASRPCRRLSGAPSIRASRSSRSCRATACSRPSCSCRHRRSASYAPGQRVRILYDAFPYQRFGAYGGRVEPRGAARC